jgi:hypothetical protein
MSPGAWREEHAHGPPRLQNKARSRSARFDTASMTAVGGARIREIQGRGNLTFA